MPHDDDSQPPESNIERLRRRLSSDDDDDDDDGGSSRSSSRRRSRRRRSRDSEPPEENIEKLREQLEDDTPEEEEMDDDNDSEPPEENIERLRENLQDRSASAGELERIDQTVRQDIDDVSGVSIEATGEDEFTATIETEGGRTITRRVRSTGDDVEIVETESAVDTTRSMDAGTDERQPPEENIERLREDLEDDTVDIEVTDEPTTGGSRPTPTQGKESGRDTETVVIVDEDAGIRRGVNTGDIARDVERDVLERFPGLTEEDVSIRFEETEEGKLRFTPEFTETAQLSLAEKAVAEQFGVDAEDVVATEQDGRVVVWPTEEAAGEFETILQLETVAEQFPGAQSISVMQVEGDEFEAEVVTGEGKTVTERFTFDQAAVEAEPQPDATGEPSIVEVVEARLESQLGRRGGSFASAMAPSTADAEGIGPGDIDLDLDVEDIDVVDGAVVLTKTGQEKIGDVQQREAQAVFEQRLSETFGVDFEPGEDFEVVESEAGMLEPELTGAGRTKVATAPLTQTVEDVEAFLGTDLPGEGPIAKDVGKERDFGNVPITIPVFGDRLAKPGPGAAPRRRTGTTTLEAELADIQTAIDEATKATTVADLDATRPITPGRRAAPRPRVSRAEATFGQEVTLSAAESVLRTPKFVVGGVQLGKNVVDLEAKVLKDISEGEFEEVKQTAEDVGQVAINTAAVGAATAIKEPATTIGAVTGSLIGTSFLFAGARAAGTVPSLTTRLLVQPGEEIAGIGGFAVTKRLAGRGAAQRFFPNREPLPFSEETYIRAAGRASRRIQRSLAATRKRIARVEGVDIEPRMGALGGSIPRMRLRTESESVSELDTEIQEALREVERAEFRRRQEAAERETLAEQALRTEEAEPFVSEPTTGGDFTPTQPGSRMRSTAAQARGRRSRLTSGAVERRRAAQRSSVESEMETPPGEVEDEAESFAVEEETRQQVEQASIEQAQEVVRVETTLVEEERLAEATRMRLEEAVGPAVEVGGLERLRTRTDVGADTEVSTRLATETMQDLRFETDTELRAALELDTEAELARELDLEAESEVEAELEAEQEEELELELELEQEFEQEFEVEVDLPSSLERRGLRLDDEDDLDLFAKRFEASVATSEEILDSAIDAVGTDVEADMADSGGDLAADLADIDGDLKEVFDNDGL